MRDLPGTLLRWITASLVAAAWGVPGRGAEPDVRELVEQNRVLVEQVRAQQKQIDELRQRLDRLDEPAAPARALASTSDADRTVRVSGEASLGFFHSGSDGTQPNGEFRVDDARIFVEAPVWKNTYFFGGLELTTREASDEYFHVGELYLDTENLWSGDRTHHLSLRVGRFNVPFGEEYQYRNVIDNPLVSHSLADIWAIDEGVQVYGQLGRVRYNLAVQNGGNPTLRDGNSDKAVTARLTLEATSRLTLSASALRTGKLDIAADGLSALWFGNAFFRSIATPGTARTFTADLAEVDARYRWPGGQLLATAGWVAYDDDSTVRDNSRHLTYYSLEGLQHLSEHLFAAARYSAIDAPHGYALAGQGNAGRYFYNPYGPLTEELRRLSVGLGYQFGPPLVWKVEYSWEDGQLVGGAKRRNEDQLSSVLGFRF